MTVPTSFHQNSKPTVNFALKDVVQWIEHPDGYWLLRNTQDVTYLQVSSPDKQVIEALSQHAPHGVIRAYDVSPQELQHLLRLLSLTGMLEGSSPPKPPKRKFTPLQLLYFRRKLINPDQWLSQHIDKLHWIWTRPVAVTLGIFLTYTTVLALHHRAAITYFGQQLVAAQGGNLLIPFILLSVAVVSIHELGHAFTLKHYGGIVPEIGLIFMCLFPAAYTNTTDAYCLIKRQQRFWVVVAGVACQLIIGAAAFWLWFTSAENTWLHTSSYLLMVAALFTVALNLNPLVRFDGYYIAVAITGINNLRSRSFLLYQRLLGGRSPLESGQDFWILLAYAPLSLIYLILIFGKFLFSFGIWIFIHVPYLTIVLSVLWLLYYTAPTKLHDCKSQSSP
ncbi:MAG: M50 family metallopeptidase [Cyanobacteria bacterium P01_D01_bin.156]